MLLFISTFYLYCNIITVFRIRAIEASTEPRCKFKVQMNNCNQVYNKRFTMYDSQEEILLHFCPNTSQTVKSIDWTLHDSMRNLLTTFTKAKNRQILVVHANSINKGEYILTAAVKLRSGAAANDECVLNYLGEPPEIKFLQGPTQAVTYNSTWYANIDKAAIKSYNDSMKVYVSCKRSHPNNCFCTVRLERFSASIEYNECMIAYVIHVIITYGKVDIEGYHYVFGIENLPVFVAISCEGNNCYYGDGVEVNPDYPVKLSLTCKSSCEKFKFKEAKWDISIFKLTFLTYGTEYNISSDNTVVTIYPNILKEATVYMTHVKYDGLYENYLSIKTIRKFLQPTCVIEPVEGTSLETLFKFNCTYDPYFENHPLIFNVYQHHGETNTFVMKSTLPTFTALLKSYVEVKQKIRISAIFDKYEFHIWTNEISIKIGKDSDERLRTMAKGMSQMFAKGDITKAMQLGIEALQMLDRAAGKISIEEQNTLYTYALHELDKIIQYDSRPFTEIVEELPNIFKNKNLTKNSIDSLSALCTSLSNVQLDRATDRSLNIPHSEIKKNAHVIKDCANRVMEYKKLKQKKTGHEFVDEPTVTEYYDDYDDDVKNAELDRSQVNSVITLAKSAQSIGVILNPTEQYVFPDPHAETIMAKDSKGDMQVKEYYAEGIVIKPIFITSNQGEVTLVLTSYKNKALESGHSFMSTNIANVGFFAAGNFKTKVGNAKFSLIFDILDDPREWEDEVVTVPNNYMNWAVPEINYNINVHRINLFKLHSCVVTFASLREGVKLLVALTVNRRPNLYDILTQGYTISHNDNTSRVLQFPFKRTPYDKFFYVGVLPHPEMLANNSEDIRVKYKVQFTQQVCLFYNEKIKGWIPANCDIKIGFREGQRKLVCRCEHSSIFSAKIEVPRNKLEPVLKFSLVTVQANNYVIFAHVCVVFLCFCIALIFSRSRSKAIWGRDKVFFLSDNLKNDRYAYLVVVKTGSLSNSGTTSNIMLRIKGEVHSRPHVLNYPDPNKSLLNKNNTDWFVLTNDVYLGTINSIELWLDNIGFRPPWFCEYVTIIDMQSKKEYFFNVERWFTVAFDDGDYAEIERTEKSQKFDIVKGITNNMKFYFGADHTWNIFVRNQDQKISYPQRLTIILSMILTTYVATIVCLGPPALVSYDAYSYGEFRFHILMIPMIIGISFISSLVNLPFVFVFRNSVMVKIEHSYIHQVKMFSLRKMIAVWVLLCIWISMCMIYLLIVGFVVTLYTSYMWMLCSVFAIIFSIFLIENIYITIIKMMSYYFKKINKKIYDIKGILTEVEFQRRALFRKFGETLLRPYFQSHYFRLTRTKVMNIRNHQKVRLEVIDLFGDMCLFISFLALLYVMVASHENKYYHLTNSNMVKILNGTWKHIHFPLDKIAVMNDVYKYINKTILPVIHAENWYGNWYMDDPGLMIDFKTKVLGVVQLRQQRHNSTKEYKRRFTYNDGKYISRAFGEINTYGGEGYIIHLGRNLDNSKFVLNKIINHNWIDNETFAVFIEFWTYNAFSNMFCSVRVVIEKNLSGDIGRIIHAAPRELLFLSNFEKALTYVFVGLFTGSVIAMASKRFIEIINKKRGFFKNIWNFADIIIIAMSLSATGLMFTKDIMISRLLANWAKIDHNEFVNYFRIFLVMETIDIVAAVLICIATIRVWKYFKFGKVFHIFGRSLQISAKDLLIIFFYHAYVFMIFSLYIFTMHNAQFTAFKSIGSTIAAIALSSKNFYKHLNKTEFIHTDHLIYVYWTIFMITSVTFYSFYSSTLMMAFQKCKIYFSNKSQNFTLLNYLTDEWYYQLNLIQRQQFINRRLKAGDDTLQIKKFVMPKATAQRYADCIFLSERKLSLMKVIANIFVRNIKRTKRDNMEEEDYLQMARFILLLGQRDSKQSKHNAYFKGREGNKIAFVSDVRIRQAAFITEKLFQHADSEHDNKPICHISGDEIRLNFIKDSLVILIDVINNIQVPDF